MTHCYMRVTFRPLKQFILPVTLVAASAVNADNRDQVVTRSTALIDSLVTCWDRADPRGLAMLWQADGDIIVSRRKPGKGPERDREFLLRRIRQRIRCEQGIATVSGRWLIVASREMEPLLGSNTTTLRGEARPSG
jgi:hypothetical protein